MKLIILKLSVTNCFLIQSKDKYILVDTGYDWEWKRFSYQLSKYGLSFKDISYIILTHHHDDHSGLLNNVLMENPAIKIIMSHHARMLLEQGKNDLVNGGYINRRVNLLLCLKRLVDKKWTLTFPKFIVRDVDILIEKEVHLRELGIELDGRIIETPGHSIDSISILFDDGDCIVGDAAANFLQFAGTKYCVIYIKNLDEYYKSWEEIINAGAKRIYPSHGQSFNSNMLKKYISANKKNNMFMVL